MLQIDWTKLPDLIAVGLLAWAFVSVARRSRTHVSRDWLGGWLLIIAHFVASLFIPLPDPWGRSALLFSILALVVAAFLFMRASVAGRIIPRVTRNMMIFMSVLFALFLSNIIFGGPGWLYSLSAALLGFTPLLITILYPGWSTPLLRWSMSILHCAMWIVLWKVQGTPNQADFAIDAVLCTVYLGCAVHFWHQYRATSTGAMIGTVGFILWASVFVLAPFLDVLFPTVTLESEIWNLPKYVVALGMILLLLEGQIEHNKHLALHDELTGLPNRRLFQDRLSGALERARRAGSSAALLMVDLDEFKKVNDTYGHHAGDQLLQKVAAILSTRVRQSDTVARTGGDEFAIILESPTNRSEASVVGRSLLSLLDQPVELTDQTVRVGACVGIAVFPDDAQDTKSLCIRADMRMYDGKRRTESTDKDCILHMGSLGQRPSAQTMAG